MLPCFPQFLGVGRLAKMARDLSHSYSSSLANRISNIQVTPRDWLERFFHQLPSTPRFGWYTCPRLRPHATLRPTSISFLILHELVWCLGSPSRALLGVMMSVNALFVGSLGSGRSPSPSVVRRLGVNVILQGH